jgi:hypothetical protein
MKLTSDQKGWTAIGHRGGCVIASDLVVLNSLKEVLEKLHFRSDLYSVAAE